MVTPVQQSKTSLQQDQNRLSYHYALSSPHHPARIGEQIYFCQSWCICTGFDNLLLWYSPHFMKPSNGVEKLPLWVLLPSLRKCLRAFHCFWWKFQWESHIQGGRPVGRSPSPLLLHLPWPPAAALWPGLSNTPSSMMTPQKDRSSSLHLAQVDIITLWSAHFLKNSVTCCLILTIKYPFFYEFPKLLKKRGTFSYYLLNKKNLLTLEEIFWRKNMPKSTTFTAFFQLTHCAMSRLDYFFIVLWQNSLWNRFPFLNDCSVKYWYLTSGAPGEVSKLQIYKTLCSVLGNMWREPQRKHFSDSIW